MRVWKPLMVMAGLTACAPSPNDGQGFPQLDEYVRDFEAIEGPLRAYFDRGEGRVFLSIPDTGQALLRIVALSAGFDWPLDTGAMPWDGSTTVLRFARDGGVLHLLEEGGSPDRSSAPSRVPIVAADSGVYLVDATALFLRDAFGVGRDLADVGESTEFMSERSEIVWPAPGVSSRSTNLDVRTTFRVPGGSQWVGRRSPDSETLSVLQRHMLIPTPSGFPSRRAPEDIGFNALTPVAWGDRAAAASGPGWIQRWRLGMFRVSEEGPMQPLMVFIARSVPEEYRSALRAGLGYWARAFEQLGLPDVIQVDELAEQSDPLSLEYPIVVMWSRRRQPIASQVHTAADPRSGEVLKSVVLLDALWPSVARNEYRSYRPALSEGAPSESEYVAARLAWLMAHEAGHVVAGLSHTGYQRTVMGFRVPRLTPFGGRIEIDLSSAVPARPFPYDVWSLEYAYHGWRAPAEDSLQAILAGGSARGLRHIGYEVGLLMPEATSRIGSMSAVSALRDAAVTRSILLDHFGPSTLDSGEPRGLLYERLVPVYFHHRFAVEGVARVVGGLRYAPVGASLRVIPAAEQWEALELLLDMLAPSVLAIPRRVTRQMPALPDSSGTLTLRGEVDDPGIFRFQTGDSYPIDIAGHPGTPFQPHAWARSMAEITIGALLHPARVSRLDSQVADDSSLPTLAGVIERLLDRVWWSLPAEDPEARELQRIARRVLVEHLAGLAQHDEVSSPARAAIVDGLLEFRARLLLQESDDPAEVELIREVLDALGVLGL